MADSITPNPFRMRVLLVVGLGIAAMCSVLFLPPIAQDQAYHNFADQRTMLGIPYLFNVISNLPFIVVGVAGVSFILRHGRKQLDGPHIDPWERWPFLFLFVGVGLTGFGSAYYHLAPSNARLFWDRLPMTIVFMSLFDAIIGERISLKAGRQLFLPLVGAGIASVVYWYLGELRGAGDLRFYGFVQFSPLLAIPLILLLFPPRYTRTADLFGAVGWYGLAKILELLDVQVFALGGLFSGHTLKHLASAAGAYWILRMLQLRRPLELSDQHNAGLVTAATPTASTFL